MTNQNKTAINFNQIDGAARQILSLKKWAEDKDQKGVEWARKQANKLLKQFTKELVIGYILPQVDEFEKEERRLALVQDKCDNAESSNLEAELNRADWEFESFQTQDLRAYSTANRLCDKDTFLEEKQGVNRATIDNRRHWRDETTRLILKMEGLQDQYELGMLSRKLVADQIAEICGPAKEDLKRVKWIKRADGGVNGYIKGKGMSATGLRCVVNTGLTILEEMGYHVPQSYWQRTSSKRVRRTGMVKKTDALGLPYVEYVDTWVREPGKIVVHEFTKDNERQEMSQEDWDQHSAVMFYQLIG
jgi:hypothetical protein